MYRRLAVDFHCNRSQYRNMFLQSELKFNFSNTSSKFVNPEKPRSVGVIGTFMLKYPYLCFILRNPSNLKTVNITVLLRFVKWLIHYRKTMLDVVHCLRCACYKRHFGSWLYSSLRVIGCHTDRFLITSFLINISDSNWDQTQNLLNTRLVYANH
jgi:hypothetical protein